MEYNNTITYNWTFSLCETIAKNLEKNKIVRIKLNLYSYLINNAWFLVTVFIFSQFSVILCYCCNKICWWIVSLKLRFIYICLYILLGYSSDIGSMQNKMQLGSWFHTIFLCSPTLQTGGKLKNNTAKETFYH